MNMSQSCGASSARNAFVHVAEDSACASRCERALAPVSASVATPSATAVAPDFLASPLRFVIGHRTKDYAPRPRLDPGLAGKSLCGPGAARVAGAGTKHIEQS